jgi:GxxExxY protein
MKIPVFYKEKKLEIDFRCDLFVEQCMVVELKAVQEVTNGFEAQLLNYMKLLQAPKGILINFNCSNIFREGQKTYINEYFKLLSEN